ncbi:WAK_assoc domain-containing protein, partial [Psidium guajava]
MSTCSILQPHHDFALTDVQAALIPPSDDTIFAVLNCSIDSPVVNHFKYLCSPDVGGHSCGEMYGACASFRIFRSAAPQGGNQSSQSLPTSTSPPCCFTRYATVRFMSMNMLDCTHYTTVIDSGGLEKSGPLDWTYGIELTYAVPESTACDRCKRSGGACGFDTESEAMLCLCSPTLNATVECAAGTGTGSGQKLAPTISVRTTPFIILSSTIYTNSVWG